MFSISLVNPLDMHIHLRQDSILESILPFSALNFSSCLAMPNLKPPLFTTKSVIDYKDKIIELAHSKNTLNAIEFKGEVKTHFAPLMSLFISDNLTSDELELAHKSGIKILKLYPKGATTNSSDGLNEVLNDSFLSLLESASKYNMILSIHGESNGFSMDREREFLAVFESLAKSLPNLKIIIEHLSDRHSLESIHKYNNLYGTITLHHALLTLDDIVGGMLNPFAFCKPIVKTPADRDAILESMLNADSKISFGSDSAPHSIDSKLNGAAGILTSPYLLESLCTLFDKHNKLENLQRFISDNAMKIYDIKLPFTKTITLAKGEIKPNDIITCPSGDMKCFLPSFPLTFKIVKREVVESSNGI